VKSEKSLFEIILLVITVLFLFFQFIHSLEHIAQAGVWTFGSKDKLYMTSLGMWGMDKVGELFFSNEEPVRKGKLGFELLHLFGNGIFLLGIMGLLYFVKSKKVIWALLIEGFHFFEHLNLTMSMIFFDMPVGFSTLFGVGMTEVAYIAYRVWWHFLFNIIPTILIALVVYEIYMKWKKRKK
jgi:hypothetical protein